MSNQGGVKLLLSAGLRYSLPQQELVDGLLFPHALHNQPVQINKQSATKTTGDPAGQTKTRSVSAASWERMKPATLKKKIHIASEKADALLSLFVESRVALMNFISSD